MTTLAFDGKSICADTLVTSGSGRVGYQRKLYKTPVGILAYCGELTPCRMVLDWAMKGLKKKHKPNLAGFDADFEVLVVSKKGVLVIDPMLYPYPANAPYTAGSGAEYAMAALHMGKTAREAVALACRLDAYSGGEIHEIFVK